MERKILELIARDRIEIPFSSLYQKTKRAKKSQAVEIAGDLAEIGGRFEGERAFAYVSSEDNEKARTMKEAVAEFSQDFPRYGKILQGKIAEKRKQSENVLYFGMNSGCRLTSDDYMGVMKNLGFSESTAYRLYPEVVETSRKLQKMRDEARSILVP
jgi:hypothetical protein